MKFILCVTTTYSCICYILIIKKIDVNKRFFHNTKMSMYREGKNTQTNIEKKKKEEEEQNCKAKRQKITDNKYKERQHRQEI